RPVVRRSRQGAQAQRAGARYRSARQEHDPRPEGGRGRVLAASRPGERRDRWPVRLDHRARHQDRAGQQPAARRGRGRDQEGPRGRTCHVGEPQAARQGRRGGGGGRMDESAKKLKLPYQTVEVDRSGRGPDGKPVDLPKGVNVIDGIFSTEVGLENDALQTPDGGLVWYDLVAVTPSRPRTLD